MKIKKILAAVMISLMTLCSCSDIAENSIVSEENTAETEAPATTMTKEEYKSAFDDWADKRDFSYSDDTAEEASDDENSAEETENSEEKSEEKTEESTEDAAAAEKNEEKPKETKPSEEKREVPANCIDVPFISQKDLPTGCELVSAAMVMQHYGFETEPLDLIEKGYIKNEELEKDGDKFFGGDPEKVYIGNPAEKTGYGCNSSVILNGLNKMLDDEFYDVYDLDGTEMKDLCTQYIDFGQPVIIWVTIEMEPLDEEKSTTWTIKESGKEYKWLANKHCVVLTGYDDEFYYIHDPQKNAFTKYEREKVEERYEDMGKQAVAVIPW